jgi:hypothetical protein
MVVTYQLEVRSPARGVPPPINSANPNFNAFPPTHIVSLSSHVLSKFMVCQKLPRKRMDATAKKIYDLNLD